MLNFLFLEKGLLHKIFVWTFKKTFPSCYILLTDEVLLSDCLYFFRYLAICVFHLLVSQAVTS